MLRSRKETFRKLFLSVPLPFSKWIYDIARIALIPDGHQRYFAMAFQEVQTKTVKGDYLEFGVFQGNSFILAAKLAERHGLKAMRFFAFDSFEGLPEDEGMRFRKGDYYCPEGRFTRMVRKAGVLDQQVVVLKGWYKQSLTYDTKRKYQLNLAAVIHVDCDLYSSTVDVLAFIKDIVQVGTIVIFDDWYAYRDEEKPGDFGEQKAFNEWSLRHAFEEFYDFSPTKAFIMTQTGQ
jgi:O-methyltransferase